MFDRATLLAATARGFSLDWNRPHWRILYYHDVPTEAAERFADQLDWFSQHFTWCTVSEGVAAIRGAGPDRPLISLTFDDADRTVYDVALPLLVERGIRACCYVVPQYVDRGYSFRDDEPHPIMSWHQLSEWVAEGQEIGSHTLSHAALPVCSEERFRQETQWSRDEIQQRLGLPVLHFAYPWGQSNRQCRMAFSTNNIYESVATTHRGPMTRGQDVYSLRRDRANPRQPVDDLVTMMKLADRFYWMRHLRLRRVKTYWRSHREISWDALPAPNA